MLMAALFVLGGCKGETNQYLTPESTTEVFVNAFCTADFETMYDCTAENNRVIIQQIEKQMNMQKEQLKKIKENKVEISKVECKMQNDSVAECVCHYKLNGTPKKNVYMLNKKDSKWLVNLRLN